jgi:cell division protein FtsL
MRLEESIRSKINIGSVKIDARERQAFAGKDHQWIEDARLDIEFRRMRLHNDHELAEAFNSAGIVFANLDSNRRLQKVLHGY